MSQYNGFIQQNVALPEARRIGIYNKWGNRVGQIPLGTLTPPTLGKRLYSFGALSDVHMFDPDNPTEGQDSTAPEDFRKALEFFSDCDEVEFICIAGDLTQNGAYFEQLEHYKEWVDTYSTKPVYAVAGNHDAYMGGSNLEKKIEQYTGHPLYYSFEYGNDAFVMVGIRGNSEGNLFTDAELEWLAETLDAYKDRRVFIFEHVRPQDGCGNALGVYDFDIWGGTEATEFERLLNLYPNIILFHGHSHLKFLLQERDKTANIGNDFTGWSVHIPSIAVPRGASSAVNPNRLELYAESEGYVVDVYENGIHLRGRDFVKGEFLPIASYWLDTTLQTVDAGTYTDSTGTIVT